MHVRTLLLPLLAAGMVLAGPAPAAARDDGKPPNNPSDPLPLRVNDAIDAGVEWLKKQTLAGGNFEPSVKGNRLYDPNSKGQPYLHPAGPTALACYTLLKCGVSKDDPIIKKAMHWLRTSPAAGVKIGEFIVPKGSYEISMLAMAIEAQYNPHKREKDRVRELERESSRRRGNRLAKSKKRMDPKDKAWLDLCLKQLRKRQSKGKGWRYNVFNGSGYNAGVRGNNDLSSTQLAMLAFLAGERAGISQPDSFYLNMLHWNLNQQQQDGPEVARFDPMRRDTDDEYGASAAVKDKARGFSYMKDSSEEHETRVTSSMTACGTANILICSSILEARQNDKYLKELKKKTETALHDAEAWFQEHWDMSRNVNTSGINGYHYYAMYCIERVGDLRGVHLIAGNPWYAEGAEILVNDQRMDGSWTKKDTHEPEDLLNTCFALLFLNRSTPAITGR